MEDIHRKVLERCRVQIVKDLDVDCIMDFLISQDIIHGESSEFIRNHATREARVRALLDILPRSGPEAYRVFRKSLYRDLSWLVQALDVEHHRLLGVGSTEPNEESTESTNVGTGIAAGISSIPLTSTIENCSNCRQPTPTCKNDKMIDTVPHVGLKMHSGEYKVVSVTQPPHLISTNKYVVELKYESTGHVYTDIYPDHFLGFMQCPRVGDSYFHVGVVESVSQTITDIYAVKCIFINTGLPYDWVYPDNFRKYCFFYYCR